MSKWQYLDYLEPAESARLKLHDTDIKWLEERLYYHKGKRAEIVNRGIQRAKLAANRTTPARQYTRRSEDVRA